MIEAIIEFSLRNRFLVIAVTALVAAFGVHTAMNLSVDAIPDLSENQVIVFADWMGRGPREIEDQVTYPLSVNLQGLAGVKSVRASSEFNFSMINVIFEDSVDFYFARQRVLERLATAATFLPPGVIPYMAPDATALGQIFWYTVEGDGHDPSELRAINDFYVRYQLNAVPGVAQVAVCGGAPREYHVDVDPAKLRAFGVTLPEVYSAVARSNASFGGRVVHKGNAEYIVRGVGLLASIEDLENVVVAERGNVPVLVRHVATAQFGTDFKRAYLEKDGREVTGGVVMMRYGANPLEVTEAIRARIAELAQGLPPGVSVVPFYDRTRLIRGALGTLTGTLTEEILVAAFVVLVILGHAGSAFVICLTLPLAVLCAFILMQQFGISSNIMSLSGIAISIGILVDQAIVTVDGATHALMKRFPDGRIRGDTVEHLIAPCRMVGRPIFFAVLIMIVSFLPVFALTGMEGKMFHPLAWTKTFALVAVSILSITLVPALLPTFLRGRIYHEDESRIVRSFIAIYKPIVVALMDRPRLVIWCYFVVLALGWKLSGSIGREFMPPLDEGSILEMPTTVPRASVTEVGDDLKVRDAIIRRFPEVESAVGKAGRADTPTDPSPLDMIETIIMLTDPALHPKRKLRWEDAVAGIEAAVDAMRGVAGLAVPGEARAALVNDAAMASAERFDRYMRELARARFVDRAAAAADARLSDADFMRRLDDELFDRGAEAWGRLAVEAVRAAADARGLPIRPLDAAGGEAVAASLAGRFRTGVFLWRKEKADLIREMDGALQMPGWGNIWTQPIINRVDMLATGVRTMIGVKVFGEDLAKIQTVADEVARILRGVPGAVDVFPDQNVGKGYLEVIPDRVKAARYGLSVADIQDAVETALGGRVATTTIEGRRRYPVRVRLARDFREDEAAVANLPLAVPGGMAAGGGAATGTGGGMGGDAGAAAAMGAGMGGIRGRRPARAPAGEAGEDAPAGGFAKGAPLQVPLSAVADIRVVEGPAMIKSENGMLRSYVQLNVRDRDLMGFVAEARERVERGVKLPPGMFIEWGGQFEHQVRARNTLRIILPIVLLLIFAILYVVYSDWAHALLMMLAVPGALAGGVIFQWFFGYNFSVAVWVGYIACFGMAAENGIIMLAYMREALADRGGLEAIGSVEELREAIVFGSVHRQRPKLLTEATAIIGLAPMLWATGVGSEIMRPMAAPIMGGLLVSDEMIDIFLPVLFYQVEKRRWLKLHERKPSTGSGAPAAPPTLTLKENIA